MSLVLLELIIGFRIFSFPSFLPYFFPILKIHFSFVPTAHMEIYGFLYLPSFILMMLFDLGNAEWPLGSSELHYKGLFCFSLKLYPLLQIGSSPTSTPSVPSCLYIPLLLPWIIFFLVSFMVVDLIWNFLSDFIKGSHGSTQAELEATLPWGICSRSLQNRRLLLLKGAWLFFKNEASDLWQCVLVLIKRVTLVLKDI